MTGVLARAATILAVTVTVGVAGAGAAAAAPPVVPPGSDALATWPTQLRALVPGTGEFTARYFGATRQKLTVMPSDSPDQADRAGQPSCTDKGGDVGLYAIDYVRQLGSLLDAIANLPGQDKLGFATTPWPGPPADQVEGNTNDYGQMPFPGGGYGYLPQQGKPTLAPNTLAHLPDPAYIASCGADLAPYGKADASSPWGFTFYDAPDQGSLDAMHAAFAAVPAHDRAGTHVLSGADSWTYMAAYLDSWAYSPTRPTTYCQQGDDPNPLCMTAMFLHCPALPTTSDPTYRAVQDCRTFNANTVLLNVNLANWLNMNGPDGRFHDWITELDIGAHWPTVRKWLLTGLALATGGYLTLGEGALVTGGLGRLLVAGAVVVTATDSWDTVWGAVSCSADLGKCLAEMAAKGLTAGADLVASAARNVPYPSMSGPTASMLDTVAGVSGVLLIALFLIALLIALFTGRYGQIIPASLGLIRWGIAMGLGATVLTMAFTASNAVADALAGSGGSTGSMSALAMRTANMAVNIGAVNVVGWLLVAVVCVVGLLAAIVVWVVVYLSSMFVPLAIALIILQLSGAAGPERLRQWTHRGWGLLWTIMLLRPVIVLIAKLSAASELEATLSGLISAVVLLIVAAVAPWLIVAMFPLAASAGTGIMRSLSSAAQGMDAGIRMGRQFGSAAMTGASRAASLGRMLSGNSAPGGPPTVTASRKGGGSGPGNPPPTGSPSGPPGGPAGPAPTGPPPAGPAATGRDGGGAGGAGGGTDPGGPTAPGGPAADPWAPPTGTPGGNLPAQPAGDVGVGGRWPGSEADRRPESQAGGQPWPRAGVPGGRSGAPGVGSTSSGGAGAQRRTAPGWVPAAPGGTSQPGSAPSTPGFNQNAATPGDFAPGGALSPAPRPAPAPPTTAGGTPTFGGDPAAASSSPSPPTSSPPLPTAAPQPAPAAPSPSGPVTPAPPVGTPSPLAGGPTPSPPRPPAGSGGDQHAQPRQSATPPPAGRPASGPSRSDSGTWAAQFDTGQPDPRPPRRPARHQHRDEEGPRR